MSWIRYVVRFCSRVNDAIRESALYNELKAEEEAGTGPDDKKILQLCEAWVKTNVLQLDVVQKLCCMAVGKEDGNILVDMTILVWDNTLENVNSVVDHESVNGHMFYAQTISVDINPMFVTSASRLGGLAAMAAAMIFMS